MSNSLPQGWEEKELSKFINFNPRESIKKGTIAKSIPMACLTEFCKSITEYEEKEFKGGTKFRNGDTLLARITPCLENGKTAFVDFLDENEVAFGSTEYIVLREKEKVSNKDFIYYLSISPQFREIAIKSMTGSSGRQRVQNDVLFREKFILPQDINEQKRIADILSAFDDKIELNNQINETLEDMATALFKEWFENFNFPNDEGKAYKENGGEFKSSELGEIPIDWDVNRIGDNVEVLGGGTPSTKNESYWIGGNINWFSPTDITKSNSMFYSDSAKKINVNGLNNSSAKEFPPYSLMLTSRATVGEIGINTEVATTNQGFITLIPNEKFPLKYLYFWLYSRLDEIHSLASGSTFKEISKRDFKKLKVLKINKQVQDLFEEKVNPIFEKIENNQKENSFLKNLRDELLPKLMSGEIRV